MDKIRRRAVFVTGLALVFGPVTMVWAECGDAVTNERCDPGDRASGRRPAESWSDFYARGQREVEREFAPPVGDDGAASGRRHRR
jgi:hypothetical protein